MEVEGCRPGLVRLRGAIGLEALLAFVQPDCRIVLAVVVGELELVCWRLMGRRRVGSGRLELVGGGLLQNLGLDPVDGDVQRGVLVLDLADLMGVALDRAEEVVELGADVRWNLIVSHGGQGWCRVREVSARRLAGRLADGVCRGGLAARAGGGLEVQDQRIVIPNDMGDS